MSQEKLSETYTLRITPSLKEMLESLTPDQRNELNHHIRVEIARAVHNAKFDPYIYLEENSK